MSGSVRCAKCDADITQVAQVCYCVSCACALDPVFKARIATETEKRKRMLAERIAKEMREYGLTPDDVLLALSCLGG